MDDCLLKFQHPKMYKSLFIKVAWSWTSGPSLKEACCFSWIIQWHADFDLKIMSNEFLFVNSIPTHHDDNFCYWNTFWEGQIKIFYIQNHWTDSIHDVDLKQRKRVLQEWFLKPNSSQSQWGFFNWFSVRCLKSGLWTQAEEIFTFCYMRSNMTLSTPLVNCKVFGCL